MYFHLIVNFWSYIFIEAMSQGCPVLISNKSALVEINQDAVNILIQIMDYEIKLKMLK